ncbi:hypothetical protein TL16_g08783 [Triparma laevis f. inornata]|uniref:Laminin IV type A domain-containing protein n=2 Tax=Triparma laevis TaxID=1534972 RepID=A0A9W7C8H0_9STRA|nr:hypothetical protein TL16_g08783 [Triparma laevis f. inornata]GMI05207.1 hypothetical protein TrLO_g13145 [Triparma laevis f. longispina]
MIGKFLLLAAASLSTALAAAPLSLHSVAQVSAGGEVVVTLPGYDSDIGTQLTAVITKLPTDGKLYQLSDVHSKYGYDPKKGVEITSVPTTIVDAATGKTRVLYVRPSVDREGAGEFDRFEYTVDDQTVTSIAGTVVVVGDGVNFIASDFSAGGESWTVEGNRVGGSAVSFEASSRGSLNHYVYGTDDSLNMEGGNDSDLWYFNAPSKFLGWQGVYYGGEMKFTMSSFSGDFSSSNLNADTYLVKLFCAQCDTNKGVTIGFPLSASSFDGSTKTFSLSMVESGGWLRDPENTLEAWTVPTKCDFVEVLSGLTSVQILGDFTKWYESVSLDDVVFKKGTAVSSIPFCAQGTPDASTCSCSGGFTS